MTTTDIDNLEGLELRRRVLTLLGWRQVGYGVLRKDGAEDIFDLDTPVESSLDAFLEHAVPFIEERGWERSEWEYVDPDYVLRYGTVAGKSATGPRTTHPATLLCRALLKAVEAQG